MSERRSHRERGPIPIDRHPSTQIRVEQVSIYGESGPAEGQERTT
jgi:hypothetical protein